MDEQATTSAPRRWLPAVGLAIVCALAVLPFFADWRSAARVPADDEVQRAVDAVRGEFRDGDAVWVEPSWWLVPRHGLERMGAGTEAWPFPALMTNEDFDPVDAYGYARLFVVAGFDREAALPAELEGADASGHELWRGEHVDVARWDLGRPIRLRTLSKEWDKAEVSRRFAAGEAPTACKVRGDKHRCGRDGWMDVALESRVVWRREVRWLFVHPGPPGSELEVAWPGLERSTAAGPTWLYVRAGQTLEAVRHPEGRAVSVVVSIDGVERDRFELDPHRFWMERRALKLPPGAGAARVSFAITSEENGWRETVLEADLLETLPEPLRRWATQVSE